MIRWKQFIRLVHPGVTRVFRAGVRAGSARLAVRVVLESAVALLIALRVSGQFPDRQNAIRHFVWQGRLTLLESSEFAARVGELHEQGSPAPVDSAVDRRNNEVGRTYAEQNAARLRTMGTIGCLKELTGAAGEHWNRGELWHAEDGHAVRSA